MIGANRQITTYRLVESGGKKTHSGSATLSGFPVSIQREEFEKASFVDQANAYNVFRLDSECILDLQESDKVVDDQSNTYIVHSVLTEDGLDIGQHTTAVLKLKA